MKVVRCKVGIRKDWSQHPHAKGLLLEKDIGVGYGRLKAKLLVFETPKNLRRFWENGLNRLSLGVGCLGAVNGLYQEIVWPKLNVSFCEVDPRYFCVIGLTKRNLSMEIICHEAMHAGFCFCKRKVRTPWADSGEFDEELICYPAGRIAAGINRALYAAKLYE